MSVLQKAMERIPNWQDNFRAKTITAGWHLALTRSMCEFLSAVADDVQWDRRKYGSATPFPDNFLAVAASLFKRGLIEQKPQSEIEANKYRPDDQMHHWTHWQLTPAGRHVVELLKLAGLFVEADAAIEKRHQTKKGK